MSFISYFFIIRALEYIKTVLVIFVDTISITYITSPNLNFESSTILFKHLPF